MKTRKVIALATLFLLQPAFAQLTHTIADPGNGYVYNITLEPNDVLFVNIYNTVTGTTVTSTLWPNSPQYNYYYTMYASDLNPTYTNSYYNTYYPAFYGVPVYINVLFGNNRHHHHHDNDSDHEHHHD